jgi:hypothetical protein
MELFIRGGQRKTRCTAHCNNNKLQVTSRHGIKTKLNARPFILPVTADSIPDDSKKSQNVDWNLSFTSSMMRLLTGMGQSEAELFSETNLMGISNVVHLFVQTASIYGQIIISEK